VHPRGGRGSRGALGASLLDSGQSVTCQCGRDFANTLTRGIQDGEATLPEEFSRPWFYDAKERAQQHQRDEEAYPEGSPWRYDDITVATNEE
jgi:hypothetical protein